MHFLDLGLSNNRKRKTKYKSSGTPYNWLWRIKKQKKKKMDKIICSFWNFRHRFFFNVYDRLGGYFVPLLKKYMTLLLQWRRHLVSCFLRYPYAKTVMCTRMARTVLRSHKELAYFSSGVLAVRTMLCVDGNAVKALPFPPPCVSTGVTNCLGGSTVDASARNVAAGWIRTFNNHNTALL